ncbi:MAG: hypothetical protein ACI93R_003714 [Flavobacteriales bacterium]|jgi:hypothetical protein
MSTVCKICINSKEEDVSSMTLAHIDGIHDQIVHEVSEWPLATENENFKIDENSPTILSIKQVSEDTTEIYYNCFSKAKELTSYLTKSLNTKAVVNMYQSTSEAGYWAYFINGELLREIDSGDGEILEDNGIKLEFEGDELGHDIGEEDGQLYVFDSDDMDEYNDLVGINVEVYQQYESNWQNYKINSNQNSSSNEKNNQTINLGGNLGKMSPNKTH